MIGKYTVNSMNTYALKIDFLKEIKFCRKKGKSKRTNDERKCRKCKNEEGRYGVKEKEDLCRMGMHKQASKQDFH